MDIEVNGRLLHLPAEVLDLIICQLREDTSAICKVRLVSRICCSLASPWILDIFETLLRLLTTVRATASTGEEPWPLPGRVKQRQNLVFTTWTRVDVTGKVSSSQLDTLRDLLCAPQPAQTYRRVATDGRLATLWGITREDPKHLWIMHRKHANPPTSHDYLTAPQRRMARRRSIYLLLAKLLRFSSLRVPLDHHAGLHKNFNQ